MAGKWTTKTRKPFAPKDNLLYLCELNFRMKKITFLLLFVFTIAFSQENKETIAVEVNFLRGNVLPHTPDLYSLVNGHPEGVMISFLKKTHGDEEWQQVYNYPDYGCYFLYQDFKSEPLGHNFSAGALYNFYFLNRKVQLKLSQGVAYTSHPYDQVNNNKNKAFGTEFMANTNIGLSYINERLFSNIGLTAGILFSHYSNGRIKSPNSGINTYLLNLGLNYNFGDKVENKHDTLQGKVAYKKEPIHLNVVFRTGINESPIIRSGQKPFYHIGFYADKRLNRKSALQLGADLFLTTTFKEFIRYTSIAYPEKNLDPNTDYKRVGIFVGHELFVNRISLEAQVGYYVYQPFKYDIPIYDRVGMKYYVTKKIAVGFTIKTHIFLAEALEFGVGYKI